MSDLESKKWCVKCRKELGGTDSLASIFGGLGAGGLYCENEDCERYGLITVAFLKPQTEAPKDAKVSGASKKENQEDR